MRPLIEAIPTGHGPESIVAQLLASGPAPDGPSPKVVLLRTGQFESPAARYSLVTAWPFLLFRSFGSQCEIETCGGPAGTRLVSRTHFGNPWHLLDALMSRFELLDEVDSPFPLGGAFGYWGYDLKNFIEPKLPRRAASDLPLPDCHVGFYDSVVVFDHRLGKVTVIATGLDADGSRSAAKAGARLEFWKRELLKAPGRSELGNLTPATATSPLARNVQSGSVDPTMLSAKGSWPGGNRAGAGEGAPSNLSRRDFLTLVERAQKYIRAGDIYQVNLSHRLTAKTSFTGWELFERLAAVSPAPFAAYLEGDAGNQCGRFEIASSSPEQFLRLSGAQVMTRPIKGTRPRDTDPTRDAQLAYELQTSAKELAELVMITDLLRNDLGKVCEYGSVQTPDLARLEKFAHVQHLVSTVEGRLRAGVTHLAAFAACFPGGSITGAPKFRAMEIIDELEPVARGVYCGAIGYLGFNRESQLSIVIRTAVCHQGAAHFNVGAGIVADSRPEAEYEETLAKAGGFLAALALKRVGKAVEI